MDKKKIVATVLASYFLGTLPFSLNAKEVDVVNEIITQQELNGITFEGTMSRLRLEKIIEWNAERIYQLDPKQLETLEFIIQKHKDLEAVYGKNTLASELYNTYDNINEVSMPRPNRPRCMASIPSDIDNIVENINEVAMPRPNRPRCMASIPSDIDNILESVNEVAMPRPNRPRCMASIPSDIDNIVENINEVAMPRPNRPRCMAAIPSDLELIVSEIQAIEKNYNSDE